MFLPFPIECYDLIYLHNLLKALDKVLHVRLLNKMRANAIRGKILAWIECVVMYFAGRHKDKLFYKWGEDSKIGEAKGLGMLVLDSQINLQVESVVRKANVMLMFIFKRTRILKRRSDSIWSFLSNCGTRI